MEQLDLFDEGPRHVREYLHVWTEAERAARIKKEPGAEAQGEVPGDRAEERQTVTACQRVLEANDGIEPSTFGL